MDLWSGVFKMKPSNDYEEVHSLQRDGHTIAIGDKIQCSCVYKIVKLNPVWDSNTKKHLINHKYNSFQYKRISNACIIHSNIS